jgi:hypothetical protein
MIVALSDSDPDGLTAALDDLVSTVRTPADAIALARAAVIVNAAFVDQTLTIYACPDDRAQAVRLIAAAVSLGEQ